MAQTPNFGFKLYEADEQPNLLDQYNNAVTAIDAAMKQLQDIVENLTKMGDLTVDGLANLNVTTRGIIVLPPTESED